MAKVNENKVVYPYIPNSAPKAQKEMMEFVGVEELWDLYEEIPEDLKYREKLNIPPAILDEYSIKKHTEGLLKDNITANEAISFLGAGCANHFVPAVVDEITTRGELLTCYGAESWADHGKYQIFIEYNSQLAELLDTDVMSVPQYDGAQAMATSICIANRINGRKKVLMPEIMNPQVKRVVLNYLDSNQEMLAVEPVFIKYIPGCGQLDMEDLKAKLDNDVTAVVIESVNFFGIMESSVEKIGELCKENGCEFIAYVDPISLGVLEAPTVYGATIVCGDLHSLGLHLSCGNGHAGFISMKQEEKYLVNFKDFIYGFVEPEVEGEYVFGNVLIERTHYARRAKGNEFTGTGCNLHMVSAAVYMSLMGPKGFEEVGETILYNHNYAKNKMKDLPGVKLPYASATFQEFVVNFDETGMTVAEINKKLLEKDIFGGLDISKEFPYVGQSALYAVTEVLTKEDIDSLIVALEEILVAK